MIYLILFLIILGAAALVYRIDIKRGYDFKSRSEAMREALGDYAAPRYDKYLTEAYKERYRNGQ